MRWPIRKSAGISLILLLAFPVYALCAQTGEISADRPAEYMVYQYPGIAMVFRIDIPETQFSSTVYGPEDALIRASGVRARRIGPLYQFVDAVDTPRQLMIEVSPDRAIDRSKVNLELIQLPENDYNSLALTRAYKLLSHGMERVLSNDTTTWAMKTYTLENASRAFAELGWEEMRLWSTFYAAHLVFHQLNDLLTALELAREISRGASRAGLEIVELAALVLEGDVLMEAAANAGGKSAQARFEQAHQVLSRVVKLAGSLGYLSEKGRALFNRGLLYEQQEQLDKAVEQFQLALDATVSAGDTELTNRIRASAASAYEALGSTSGAIGMLDDIGSDLEEGQASGEESRTDRGRAANLFEKGRILNSNFRFPEAAGELSKALQIRRASPSGGPWGPTGLALAWAHYSMGETETAEKFYRESIPRTSKMEHRAALRTAYGAMAHIFRQKKQFIEVQRFREQQRALVESERQRADLLFETGVDAWQRDGPRSQDARKLLQQSRSIAKSIAHGLAENRAVLYLCLLNLQGGRGGGCSDGEAGRAHRKLKESGIPSLALDADFVMARIQRRSGKTRQARNAMDRLMDDLTFYDQALPGVLGAWYWENRESIFRELMSISLSLSGAGPGKVVDGGSPLQALERIRQLESSVNARRPASRVELQDENLRALLARRVESENPDSAQLASEWEALLTPFRKQHSREMGVMEPVNLENVVASLGRGEVILAYYFEADATYAFLVRRNGVQLRRLTGTTGISDRLRELHTRIAEGDFSLLPAFEELGNLMLGPVSAGLENRIYLLPSGPLIGLPFDAFRLDGRFLAEKHQLVHLMSLAAVDQNRTGITENFRNNVFLAGNPQAGQRLFDYDVDVSAEIEVVTDLFVGAGLHIVQGLALTKEEFQDERFRSAMLLHLAAPGRLDLDFPERSRLWMSAGANEPEVAHLAPGDVGEFRCSADLLVLSQTEATGVGRTGFDSRIGIVSDFLDSCTKQVIATLWPVGDGETAIFATEFYRKLETVLDASEALWDVKKSRIGARGAANFRSWAGFQLHIR